MSVGEAGHTRRRRRLVGALSVTLLTGGLATVPASASVANADSGAFIRGSATALAQAIQIAPATGGLNYAITSGIAIGGYSDEQGQAQAQTLDLGVIGTTLAAEGCDGSAAVLPKDQQPQPLIAQSMGKPVTKQKTYAGQVPPAAFGSEYAEATGTPSGHAKTTGMRLGVPGVLTVDGATSEATGQLIDNAARQAEATTRVGTISLADGVVRLDGLTWHAVQRTGKGASHSGGFTIGSIELAGQKVPFDQQSLGQVTDALNTALAPLGLHIELPTVTTAGDGTVHVTPLVIGMKDNQLGQQTLGVLVGAGQPVRDALFQAMTGISCKMATFFLLGDIGTGPLTGAGSLDVNIGGASAGSEGVRYDNPFGDVGSFTPPSLPPVSSPSLGSGSLTTTGSGAGTLPASGEQAVAPQAAGEPTVATAPVVQSRSCSSVHPGGGSCSADKAFAVGLAGLGAVLAIGAADAVLGRRRRRRLPQLRL